MKRAIMAAALMLMPAAALAQDDDQMTIPEVPKLALVPTRSELDLLRESKADRWIGTHALPADRPLSFGDPEREQAWASTPFGSPYSLITLFRF